MAWALIILSIFSCCSRADYNVICGFLVLLLRSITSGDKYKLGIKGNIHILIFALIFALTNCYLKIDKCTGPIGASIYIDTTKDYKYNVEFDWTDDDDKDFKVPIYVDGGSISDANVIPLFINASTVSTRSTFGGNRYSYGSATINTNDVPDGDIASIKIYTSDYNVYYPFDASISSTEISAKIKSTTVKANEYDVTQKFIKYFGIAYCSGVGQVTVKTFDNILVTVNNGNYFSTSKILLACLALLFL